MVDAYELKRLSVAQLKTLFKMLRVKKPSNKRMELIEGLLTFASGGIGSEDELDKAYARLTDPNARVQGEQDGGLGEDDVRAMILDIVEEKLGVVSAETVAKEVARLAKGKLNQYRPLEIVQAGSKPKKFKQVMPPEFDRVVKLASQRVNVMLVGPAGCGKTYMGEKVAEALGLRFSSISCSAGMSESQLAGWLLPVGKVGTFEYVPSPFVEMYEKGGVFLLDEIDAADPNTLTFINKAIANGAFYLPQRYNKPEIKRHKDFVCLAAANTYGTGADAMYVGRNQLDAATLDRFRAGMVVLDYSPEVEEALVHPEVLKWGRKIREVIYANKLRKVLSTRVMLDLTKMVEAYKWDRKEWNQSYFADWKPDELSRMQGKGGE